ncbi:MAG: SsrA-binding protein SmpB [Flavobacteriales bacterium]|nr:SsrA-binding protein SmpB [Bacteroidota bacterium]MCB9239880.1 SsrA-binding protein SmpB [Flavobacteriales bacterium]
MAKRKSDQRIRNRRASFDYHLEQEFDAGMVLTGPEIKSVRDGKASITEAYCLMTDTGMLIRGMHIAEFKNAGYVEQKPHRDRQLLLTKSELKKIRGKLKDVGYTVIPVEVFFSESGYAKLKIALARGKKTVDKREDLKSKDQEREMRRFAR